jgi:hypothetical protein
MAIVDVLLRNAYEDTQLLLKNDSLGDQLQVPRDVDFLLRATDAEKAHLACSFINDNQYGSAEVQGTDVRVVIHTPIQQNIICSISGLMACISEIFGLEYDGWGSELRKAT